MEISDREITTEEYNKILADFKKIEREYSLPDKKSLRLNVTVDKEDQVIGFASGLINHKWFFLSDLWVRDAYRGQGLGAKILKMLEDNAKKYGVAHIYTWTTNYNSNEIFYKKQGYQQCLVFENYFEVENGHHICLKKDF